jgi:hypothetical protein
MHVEQTVSQFLAQRRGHWCCDGCLALALNLLTLRSAQYITDTFATNGAYSRRRAICRDCNREKLVTMAS